MKQALTMVVVAAAAAGGPAAAVAADLTQVQPLRQVSGLVPVAQVAQVLVPTSPVAAVGDLLL